MYPLDACASAHSRTYRGAKPPARAARSAAVAVPALSASICVPTSLDQEVGEGLGAQAGQAKLSEVIGGAGFSKVRRATEGPFNMILEARI